MITEIVHTHDNGDIEYKVPIDTDYSIRGIGWCLVLLTACLCCFLIQKWIDYPFSNIASGIFALCAIVLFGILYRRSRLIEKEEYSFVTSIIHGIIEQDAIPRNQKVVNIKFCSDTLDSYGTIDEEYILVLLSDKTILKYHIEQLDCKDKQYNYKLIKRDFSICTNETQTQKILRSDLQHKILKSPSFIIVVTWIVIIVILATGGIVIFLFVTNIHNQYDAIILLSIPFCLLVFIPLYRYADKILPKNKACNIIRFILLIPTYILELSKLIMPSLTIMMAFFLMFAYSFLPVFLAVRVTECLGYTISLNANIFILLTFPFIIASQGAKTIRNIILKHSPFRENNHHYQLFMRELVKFLYTKENLNFIIYTGYFFFLTVSAFKTLQTGETLLSQDIDLIVSKSFLAYIACINMFDRKKSSNLEGNALLSLLIKMLLSSDDETWRKKRKSHQLND